MCGVTRSGARKGHFMTSWVQGVGTEYGGEQSDISVLWLPHKHVSHDGMK